MKIERKLLNLNGTRGVSFPKDIIRELGLRDHDTVFLDTDENHSGAKRVIITLEQND